MCSTRISLAQYRAIVVILFAGLLAACSDGGSSSSIASQSFSLAGSVGDGPVVDAEIEVTDANGEVVVATTSDAFASYQLEIPQGTPLPVTITARGGVDLVTGRPLDFALVAASSGNGESQINLNPQSTLMVATAECSGKGVSARALNRAWKNISSEISMGLDPTKMSNPMTSAVNTANIADIVLSSEALAETIRRTAASMQNAGESVDADDVIAELGCDLANDARVDGASVTGTQLTGAVFRAAEAAVLVELIAGDLQVDGASATALMDAAARTVSTDLPAASVAEIPVSTALADRALNTLLLLQSVDATDVALLDLADVITDAPSANLRDAMASSLDAQTSASLTNLRSEISSLDQMDTFTRAAIDQLQAKAPFISLTVATDQVVEGDSATLSWAAADADRCLANGEAGWNGPVGLSGTFTTDNLDHSVDFQLACYSAAGSNRSRKRVMVLNNDGLELVNDDKPTQVARNNGRKRGEEQAVVTAPEPTPTPTPSRPAPVTAQPAEELVVVAPPSPTVPPVTLTPAPAPAPASVDPAPSNGALVADAVYADQEITDCNTYEPATRQCGAGTNVAYSKLGSAMSNLAPGDTLYVRGGADLNDANSIWNASVSEEAGISPSVAGTANSPIVVQVYPGERVIVNGPGSSGVGLALDGSSSNYVIDGFVLRNFAQATEGFGSKTNVTLKNLEFYDMAETGMLLRDFNGLALDEVHVHNVVASGISIRNSRNVTVTNSSSSFNNDDPEVEGGADGLHTIAVENLVVDGFTAEGNADDGLEVHTDAVVRNVVSRNNAVCNVKTWRGVPASS